MVIINISDKTFHINSDNQFFWKVIPNINKLFLIENVKVKGCVFDVQQTMISDER